MQEIPWQSATHPPALGLGEVHLWRVALQGDAGELLGLLSEDEQARARRFHFERDRQRFIIARASLRKILAGYVGLEASRLRFHYTPQGKPFLEAGSGGGSLDFNLSHSAELALYAVTTRRRIGVDLEHLRPVEEAAAIVARLFARAEQERFCTLSPAAQLLAFFTCWTRKEAFVKARGEGLTLPLDRFAVSLLPDEPARLLSVAGAPDEAARWSMFHLKPAEGYVAAVVVEGQVPHLSFFQLER